MAKKLSDIIKESQRVDGIKKQAAENKQLQESMEQVRAYNQKRYNSPRVKKSPGLKFEEILTLMIEHGDKSTIWDYKQIGMALKEGDRNAQFQSKRIKDALRMLFDIGLKISKEA